jgi:hypothetical protein
MQGLLRAMTRIRLACRGHEASVKKVRNFRRQTCSCARNQIRPVLRQADCSDTGTDWHQRPIEPLRDLLDTPPKLHDDVAHSRLRAPSWMSWSGCGAWASQSIRRHSAKAVLSLFPNGPVRRPNRMRHQGRIRVGRIGIAFGGLPRQTRELATSSDLHKPPAASDGPSPFFVENVECRQADVADFLLTKDNFVVHSSLASHRIKRWRCGCKGCFARQR